MSIQIPSDHRRIIPRWRYSRIALSTGELSQIRSVKLQLLPKPIEFQNKLQLWQKIPSIELAADLVASGFSQGFLLDVVSAAEYLIENEENVVYPVLSLANELLVRSGKKEPVDSEYLFEIETAKLYPRIHNLRKALIEFPNNSFMWVDLSRSYGLLGQWHKAEDAMRRALIISPSNRFVLRSASRLYVHLDEPDHAHWLLLKQDITRKDPWLMAAEIAIANVADITPKYVKNSRDILDSKTFHPFHLAELNSAIATVELSAGANRKARKLFETSLISPTENSVAQSAWAKQKLPTLDLGNSISATPRTYEAKTWSSYLELDWNNVVRSSMDWLLDEPFSSRPAELGSFAATIGLDDFKLAESITKSGLVANPGDQGLLNNQAFALANQNRLEEAMSVLRQASRPALHPATESALRATEGMINLRLGNYEEGEKNYLDAISLAKRESMNKVVVLASIFYAREINKARILSREDASQFIDKAANTVSDIDIKWISEKVKKGLFDDVK